MLRHLDPSHWPSSSGILLWHTHFWDISFVASLFKFSLKGKNWIHLFLQYDCGCWMPNTPTSLQRPPPTAKWTTSEATMLQTLPGVSTTVQGMSAMWLLSKESSDFASANEWPMTSVCLAVCSCHSHLINPLSSFFWLGPSRPIPRWSLRWRDPS